MIKKKLIWFDFLRGISALLVCVSHIRNMIFLELSAVEDPNMLTKLFYFVTGLGHQSVIVFFVLSGYFVGGSVLKKKNNFSWGDYTFSRLSRLWVVLIPALLLTVSCDLITLQITPDIINGGINKSWHSGPSFSDPWVVNIKVFAANIFFLQSILFPVFGTNGPLWSLAYEFWFYALFPLILSVFGIIASKGLCKKCLLFLILAFILLMLPKLAISGFIVWLLGVLVCSFPIKKWKLKSLALTVFLVLFSSGICLSKVFLKNDIISDLALAFSLLPIIWFLRDNDVDENSAVGKFSIGTSAISFTLYVTHFPVATLLAAAFLKGKQMQPSISSYAIFIFVTILAILVSIVMWWCFERNTMKVKKTLKKFKSILSSCGRIGVTIK
ncbi:acyltransferase [Roseibacillus persicicus]|uniref:acyltransferase family protein n=1 Tax=Roseibacillus persicicus TaxID=454148 RepID=UPI00398B8D9B